MRRVLLGLLAAVVLAAAMLGVMIWQGDGPLGIERLWTLAAGDPDQGPVDFAALARRDTPNDALVCPRDLCRAIPDIASPTYAMPADGLRETLRAAILATPHARQVAVADGRTGDRFVVRTPLMRFPDTVDLLVVPRDAGHATFALYSRSQLGRSDLGANLGRIRAWLGAPALAAAARRGS
jgi:uncharacterized protein (DUF1499 family)